MNNMLTDMYRSSANEQTRKPPTQNDFPIDISSDESDADNSISKNANNGTHFHSDYCSLFIVKNMVEIINRLQSTKITVNIFTFLLCARRSCV